MEYWVKDDVLLRIWLFPWRWRLAWNARYASNPRRRRPKVTFREYSVFAVTVIVLTNQGKREGRFGYGDPKWIRQRGSGDA